MNKKLEETLKSFWTIDSTQPLNLNSLNESEKKICDGILRAAEVMRENVKRFFSHS
jgi:hypothetical protein